MGLNIGPLNPSIAYCKLYNVGSLASNKMNVLYLSSLSQIGIFV